MAWTDQVPPAEDVVFTGAVYTSSGRVTFEIDKLQDGAFRATIGDLFGSKELIRGSDLETVLRKVRNFTDVVHHFRRIA